MSESKGEILVVEIPMEEGDPLGATPDEQFVIIQIQKDTLADGKLQAGDKILSVNDRQPKDVRHFYRLLNVAAREQDKAILRIRRDTNKARELDVHNQIPANRAKYIQRSEGFLYKLVSIAYQKGQPLGLSIKQRQNRVLVSRIMPDSLSARAFEVLDQIIDVDGQRVTELSVAETMIKQGFHQRRYFTAIIARPSSAEARRQVQESLNRSSRAQTQQHQQDVEEEPSVKMAPDVYLIARKEIERIHSNQVREGESILATSGAKHSKHAVIADRHQEKRIASDIQDEGQLRHVGLVHSHSK